MNAKRQYDHQHSPTDFDEEKKSMKCLGEDCPEWLMTIKSLRMCKSCTKKIQSLSSTEDHVIVTGDGKHYN